MVPGVDIKDGLRELEKDRDVHMLYAAATNVTELELYFIGNMEENPAEKLREGV